MAMPIGSFGLADRKKITPKQARKYLWHHYMRKIPYQCLSTKEERAELQKAVQEYQEKPKLASK
jgi:hypothetical protein